MQAFITEYNYPNGTFYTSDPAKEVRLLIAKNSHEARSGHYAEINYAGPSAFEQAFRFLDDCVTIGAIQEIYCVDDELERIEKTNPEAMYHSGLPFIVED